MQWLRKQSKFFQDYTDWQLKPVVLALKLTALSAGDQLRPNGLYFILSGTMLLIQGTLHSCSCRNTMTIISIA